MYTPSLSSLASQPLPPLSSDAALKSKLTTPPLLTSNAFDSKILGAGTFCIQANIELSGLFVL